LNRFNDDVRLVIEPIQSRPMRTMRRLEMATYDLYETLGENEPPRRIAAPGGVFAPLRAALWSYRRRLEEHRILIDLSRKDPRLLRDMGFDPEEIYDAVANAWDEARATRGGGHGQL
jgi:hypothetical protein